MMDWMRAKRALAGLVLGTALAGSPAAKGDEKNIVETAAAAGQFRTLVTAVKAAGLATTLAGPGPFTVFAPTDQAFAKLPEGTLDSLLENPAVLESVLLYHVVPGKFMAADVSKLNSVKTALGQTAVIDTSNGVRVDSANVVQADVAASNGVIHVIDAVIMPRNDIIEAARSAGSFRTLLAAIEAAGLTDTLRGEGPFTVFAPTDAAFAKLPKETLAALLKDKDKLASILTYHVLPGKVMAAEVVKLHEAKTLNGLSVTIDTSSGVAINGAMVFTTDVPATNGVIHVIDTVLLPPDVKLGSADDQIERSIRLAINRGAPLFNSGNADACAGIYEVTAATVLNLAGPGLDPGARARLEGGLRDARHAHSARESAWALRHAFDDVLAGDHGFMAMTMTGSR